MFFRQGLFCVLLGYCLFFLRILFFVHPVVGASSHVVGPSSVLVCCQGLVCVPSGPYCFFESTVCTMSRSQLSVTLVVLVLPMRRARLGRVRDLRRPHPPWRPTCHGYRGSWSRADLAVNQQVRVLCAFLESYLGAAYWRSSGDTVESWQRLLMLTAIGRVNRRVDFAK